jgi:hypothetical protein
MFLVGGIFVLGIVLGVGLPNRSPEPSAVPATQAPRTLAPDPWRATEARATTLRTVIQTLRRKHPEWDRLFSIYSIRAEIPTRIKVHVQDQVEGAEATLLEDWEHLAQAFQSWLRQLGDWQREHPEAEKYWHSPEIRRLLQEEAIPLLMHMIEDYLVDWAQSVEPREFNPVSHITPAMIVRWDAFLDQTTGLRILLEDAGDGAPGFLPLRALLPASRADPAPDLGAFEAPLTGALQSSPGTQELWLLGRSILHAVAYDSHGANPDRARRQRLLRQLEAVLAGPDCPLSPRERAMLQGRMLVEIVRMLRSANSPVDLPGDPMAWLHESLTRVLSRAREMPEVTYSALWSTQQVFRIDGDVVLVSLNRLPLVESLFRREGEAQFLQLQKSFQARDLLCSETASPEFSLVRTGP